MNMDLPLDMTATRLPFGENVIKLEPSNQLNEPENVEEGGQQQLYRHSPDIVKKLALSLSPCSHPPPLTTSQLKQKERGTSMANSSPSARRGEKSTQKLAGGEKQLQLSDIAEPAVEVQPATVKVHASRHGSSSSDRLNLPTSSVMEKEVTQGVLKEAMIHPTTVKAYSVSHDIKPTNQPQLNLASHGVNTTDQEPGKDGAGEREEGERERVKGGGTERERRNKEVTATSSIGDQLAGIAIHSVSSLAVIEGGDNHTPDSSQNLSQQPGPPNWSESQRRSLDSDAFYSSDSQPPSLKMIRLESPSPSPDSPLSLLVAQIDGQLPQQQDPECRYTTKGSPLSLLVAQMDTQSPQRLDPESSHGTGGSILSLLVSQMDAQSSHQQDTNLQNATKEPPSLVEQMDAQSQQQREPECHHTVEQSPLSQLIAQMDAQSGQQRDPEHQNLTEENHQIACSVSGGFICSPLPNGGEEEEEKEMEGERGRIEPTVVGCEREEPHDKVRGDGDGRVLERGGRDGYALHNIFGKFGGYKQKVQAGCWVKRNEAASRRGEKSSSTGQRSTTKGQNSNSVNCATEQPSTSSGQGSSGDRGFRHQHHDEGNLGEGVFDEHGTLEVDVVGTASQPATLEVDVEGAYSSADEMKTTGAAPLKDGPITSQVQQSAAVKSTAHEVVESAKGSGERSRVEKSRLKTKKMSLTIDKSKKDVRKKDSTGNITMETPRHSQPPFQPKQKLPELYSQEYHHSSASNGPAGSHTHNASSSRSSVGTANKDLSNLDNPLSKNTGNNLSSVGPSTSKVFIMQGSLNISPSKHNRDISVTQNDASNSNLSTRRGPVVQTVISSYGIKSKDPSTRGDLSNRSPYKSSKDLFASSNPSLTPSNSKNKEAVFTQGRRTKTNAPSSSSHGNTKLVSKKRGTSATQISLNIPTHSGPLRCATPLSSSNTPSPGRSHSRSMTPSSIRQSSPDFEPYVRVIDPVYHDDPQLERWRQLMQAHWFEVKMVKSRQPLSMAEKRSLKQFGLLDDHNQ